MSRFSAGKGPKLNWKGLFDMVKLTSCDQLYVECDILSMDVHLGSTEVIPEYSEIEIESLLSANQIGLINFK